MKFHTKCTHISAMPNIQRIRGCPLFQNIQKRLGSNGDVRTRRGVPCLKIHRVSKSDGTVRPILNRARQRRDHARSLLYSFKGRVCALSAIHVRLTSLTFGLSLRFYKLLFLLWLSRALPQNKQRRLLVYRYSQ